MDITLDQLRALEAIARRGSFAAAAEELHRVPSAVSYLVAGLESATGLSLFDRSRRRAALTAEGKRILDASKDILFAVSGLENLARELSDGWEPTLHVVVEGALPMGPLSESIRRFSDPEIPTRLVVDVEYNEGVLHRFDAGPADIALLIGFDPHEDTSAFHLTPLPPLVLVFVASAEHPLAQGPADEARRAEHAELIVRDSSPARVEQPKPSFIGSRNVVYLSDFHSKRMALLAGAGYGWIPSHFVDEELNDGRLVRLDAELNEWTYHPQIAVRANQRVGPAARIFLDGLLSADQSTGG